MENTDNIINPQIISKIIRKKTIWAEIKAHEQEYMRLGKQIHELEDAKKDITFLVQKKLAESQEISEWLDGQEYEALKNENK